MNAEKAQTIINQIVADYRANDYTGGRKQYAASKKYINRATELGIIDMIPDAPGSNHIGNTEIQLILKAAEDSGSQVGGMVDGEGDVISVGASELYKTIHEVEAVEEVAEPIKESAIEIGSVVIIKDITVYSDLVGNAIVTPMIPHFQHQHTTSITDAWSDEIYNEESDSFSYKTVFVTASGFQVTVDQIESVVS